MLLLLKAHVRLNHFGLSVAPDATLGMVDRLAAGYDIKVLEWMQKLQAIIQVIFMRPCRGFSDLRNSYLGETDLLMSYQIVGDNVDLHQQATHHSMDWRDKDHHWFHLYAVRDRICDPSLQIMLQYLKFRLCL